MKGKRRDGFLPLPDYLCNPLLNLLWGPPFAQSRRKGEDAQVPLYTNHRNKLGLQGSVRRTPVFFVSIADFSTFPRRGGCEGDVSEVLELTVRQSGRGGGTVEVYP